MTRAAPALSHQAGKQRLESVRSRSRRRTTWAVTASVLAHLLVVTVVVLQKPMLRIPPDVGEPPPAIIPVLLLPKTPPSAAGQHAAPQPIRLHRRPQRFIPPEITPAPIAPPQPPAPEARPTPKGPVTAFHPAPLPQGPKSDVRTALRQSPVGCANADAVGLTRAERDLCNETLGKGVRAATPFAVGAELSAEKRRLLDAQAALRDDDIRYKREQSGAPNPPSGAGETAEQMCKDLGIPPEKCSAKVRR
jgi:hypothetical protein